MGLATWPAATLIKKNMSYWSPFNKSRPRGGVFLRKILSTFVLLSVLIKKGNGHFLSLWSMHGSAVHGPACDILYDICNTMTESSTRRLKLLTLNYYNMSNRKNYAAPEMQSFEVNAEAGFAVSQIDPPGYKDGQGW